MDTSTKRLVFLRVICFTCVFVGCAKLHPDEVTTLKSIAKKLGKTVWDFEKDPCSGHRNSRTFDSNSYSNSDVSCVCQIITNVSICHIYKIELKGQNLSGDLPDDFSKLKYLKSLDLSRNLFTGSIPSQWATMNLVVLNLTGNKLSGPFPSVLINISTLESLTIEANNFSGFIPPEIGRLRKLETLSLSSNGFTGNIPLEFVKLVNLKNLMISDTDFTGKIPYMFHRLKNIHTLHIQGTFLEGPIPASISSLNLMDLRISDLKGDERSDFPDLSNMKSLRTLILRNCFLTGNITKFLGNMKMFRMLDLSFNKLDGIIPEQLSPPSAPDIDRSLSSLDEETPTSLPQSTAPDVYLRGNKLTGPIPQWIYERNTNMNLDISENNFTWDDSGPIQCMQSGITVVEGYSPSAANIGQPCLIQGFPCASEQSFTSLYINCGGKEVTLIDGANKYEYEADLEDGKSSMYYHHQNWAVTSTGIFMGSVGGNSYLKANSSTLITTNVSSSMQQQLYTTARTSPMSLTYYGLCLVNGSYTVDLHFTEIVFTNNVSDVSSLGRRVFDVYIQGNLVLKDFNIVEEAGGANTPIVKTFIANVTTSTLKVDLYWAGRGTQDIPTKGNYGPLISAISVSLHSSSYKTYLSLLYICLSMILTSLLTIV